MGGSNLQAQAWLSDAHAPRLYRSPPFDTLAPASILAFVRLTSGIVVTLILVSAALAGEKPQVPVIRFAEGSPNCAVRVAEDGHVYYSLSNGDYEIMLSLDRQELEKVQHRVLPMLGVLLTFKYTGAKTLEVQQNRFTLEFVKHFQVVQSSLDPDLMLQNLQQHIDDYTDEVERHQVKHHPDEKEKAEGELQAHLKDYTEMMDFVSTRALRPSTLDPANSGIEGWVFFSTKNRWIGGWRRPEQFILRLPVEDVIVEFPFQLPPQHGKVELRTR